MTVRAEYTVHTPFRSVQVDRETAQTFKQNGSTVTARMVVE